MKIIFFLAYLFALNFLNGQNINFDLYSADDIIGDDNIKKELIQEVNSNGGSINYFKHFYYTSNYTSVEKYNKYENDFLLFIDEIKGGISKIKKPTNTKIAEYIFAEVNNKYFKTFDIDGDFSSIFESGTYNLNTSSIVFAVVFNALDIPFRVVETEKCYLVYVYPSEENLVVFSGTGSFDFKYYRVNDGFKQKFVAQLIANNIIKEDDLKNSTKENIFNEYYYKSYLLNLREFIGSIYFNKLLIASATELNEQHLNNLIIGSIYYPGFRANIEISEISSIVLSNKGIIDYNYIKVFEILTRNNISFKAFIFEQIYNDFSKKILFEKSNIQFFDSASNYLISKTPNKEFKNYVLANFNNYLGRFKAMNYEYEQSIPYLMKAHKYDPLNIETRSLLVESIFKKFKNSAISEKGLTVSDTFFIENCVIDDSLLFEDFKFRVIYIFYLSEITNNFFKAGNIILGDRFLNKFEYMLNRYSNLLHKSEISEDLYQETENVYREAAKYYQDKLLKKKAREYIYRGLKILPDSERLKNKLKYLE